MPLPYSWICISVNDNSYFKLVCIKEVARALTILIYLDHYENSVIVGFFHISHICIAYTNHKRMILADKVDLCVYNAIALCLQGKQPTLSV